MPRQPALPPEILQAALEGLELQRQRIDQQIAKVKEQLGQKPRGRPPKATKRAAKPAGKKRNLSAEARQRIAAAQRKRWAEWRKAKKAEKG